MQPPRGPRSVLWVVNVTTSANGTGSGAAPPAISPAMWAASNMNSAPTSSAIARNGSGSSRRGYDVVPATISFGRCSRARSRIWSKSMRSSPGVTLYGTNRYIRPLAFTGEPWVRWPPWSSDRPSTVSPGSSSAWYAHMLALAPECGWTLACSAPNSALTRSMASASTESMTSLPP